MYFKSMALGSKKRIILGGSIILLLSESALGHETTQPSPLITAERLQSLLQIFQIDDEESTAAPTDELQKQLIEEQQELEYQNEQIDVDGNQTDESQIQQLFIESGVEEASETSAKDQKNEDDNDPSSDSD